MAMELKAGDVTTLEVNQGHRDAKVLAVIGHQALVEYAMPGGSTALRLLSDVPGKPDRSMSYWSIPLKWLLAIDAAGQDWEAQPQQCGRRRPGTVAETIAARRKPALMVE